MSCFQNMKMGHILGIEVLNMPYALLLSKKLRNAGWKVKIFDKEAREPPHITVMRGAAEKWRIELRTQWDTLYPENPVSSQESN